MTQHLDLTDLRLLVNTADSYSLTKGAERSHLSVPSASVRVKNMEDCAGTKLFERRPRGVELTPAGQAMVHHARIVLNQMEQLGGELRAYSKGTKGHLRIAANTTALTEYLPQVLATFLDDHPDISIDLKARATGDVIRSVQDRRADIGLVTGCPQGHGLNMVSFYRDRIVLVVPEGHELAAQPSAAFRQTLDLVQVGLCEGSELHHFLQAQAAQLSSALNFRVQVSNIETACSMIDMRQGIGLLPESAARRHARGRRIALVPLDDCWAQRDIQLCTRQGEQPSAFMLDFLDLLATLAPARQVLEAARHFAGQRPAHGLACDGERLGTHKESLCEIPIEGLTASAEQSVNGKT